MKRLAESWVNNRFRRTRGKDPDRPHPREKMRQYNKRPYFVLSRSKPRGRAVPAPEHAPPPPGHGASAPGSNDSRETTESVESCDSCEAAAAWHAALAPIHKIPIKLFDTAAMCISLLILYDFCASYRSRSGGVPSRPSEETPPASLRGKDGLRRAGFPCPVDFPTGAREEGALRAVGHEHSYLIP